MDALRRERTALAVLCATLLIGAAGSAQASCTKGNNPKHSGCKAGPINFTGTLTHTHGPFRVSWNFNTVTDVDCCDCGDDQPETSFVFAVKVWDPNERVVLNSGSANGSEDLDHGGFDEEQAWKWKMNCADTPNDGPSGCDDDYAKEGSFT